jgi:DNA-binding NtrC family response regulator
MCKVLVLDDEVAIREIICAAVREADLVCIEAHEAISAGLLIKKHKDIRIVLCDLYLPGIDGLTFCRKIKCMDPLMVLIALTGYQTLFSVIECRQAGYDDVLFKPKDVKLIPEILRRAHAKVKRWKENTSV